MAKSSGGIGMTDERKQEWVEAHDDHDVKKVEKIAEAIRTILVCIGEDPDREGLKDTPFRVAKMYIDETCSGYEKDLVAILNEAKFTEKHDEIVLVKDIPFYSLCEHHIMPFMGKAHVAYIPGRGPGNIVGISKLARIVDVASKKLQIQEGLTQEIANALEEALSPMGVAVIIEGMEHTCMTMRGIQKPGSKTITSAMRGVFKANPSAKAELMALIGR